MRIVVDNLSYNYGGKNGILSVKALNGVSLTVEEGDFLGVIGETGSGKSTFVQHLNGLIKPQKGQGKIFVGEYDLTDKKCDYKKLRSKIGMVFQYPEYQLFAETVESDVAFALKNFAPDLDEKEIQERVKEALTLVGLNYDEIKDVSPFELSGGQKRRVAIAGVIVYKPEVLILDEPAAGLDPKGKAEFLSLIKSLHQDFVKTVIIVSHDMNIISEYCNKAVVFSHGKIIKEGTPEEIFSDETFIENNGLELPVVSYLTKTLKEKGVYINEVKKDEFVKAIISRFGGEK